MCRPDQSFPKSVRLRTSDEFNAVYSGDIFATDNLLVVKAIRNGTNGTRLGLSVGRKVGNAVVRNRWKRLIREGFRTQQDRLPKGLDLVVRPRKGAICDGAKIKESLFKLTKRIMKKLAPVNGRPRQL